MSGLARTFWITFVLPDQMDSPVGPLAEFATAVPGHPDSVEVPLFVAGLGYWSHHLVRGRFGETDPGHQVATGFDDQSADVVEQLLFVVVMAQGQVAFAQEVQCPVELVLFVARLLPFGNIGMDADHAHGAALFVPCDDLADGLHPQPRPGLGTPAVFHGFRAAGFDTVGEFPA